MLASQSAAQFKDLADSWLRRKAPKAPKVHRKKAYYTLMTLDHQIRLCTGVSGLQHFVVDLDKNLDPFLWPSMSICVDQEGSNMTALGFAQRVLKCNFDAVYDPSHGVWNDVRRSIKDSGDWCFMLMLLASWSMRFGPFQQGQRAEQVEAVMKEYKDMVKGPEHCSWFQECLPLIAKDRREVHRLGDPTFVAEVWEDAVGEGIWKRRGTRPSLNRFMSLISEGSLFLLALLL